jgi:hypothetical protein
VTKEEASNNLKSKSNSGGYSESYGNKCPSCGKNLSLVYVDHRNDEMGSTLMDFLIIFSHLSKFMVKPKFQQSERKKIQKRQTKI